MDKITHLRSVLEQKTKQNSDCPLVCFLNWYEKDSKYNLNSKIASLNIT